MQISNGTVTVTNGSPVVVASTPEMDWTDAMIALSYGHPVLFSLLGDTEVLRIAVAAEAPGTSASGKWELTLDGPWTGEDGTDVGYMIHTQFTPNYGLPLPAGGGERQWGPLLSRAFVTIDANMGGAGAGMSPGLTTTLKSGKTLVVSHVLEIPDGATLDVKEGAATVIL